MLMMCSVVYVHINVIVFQFVISLLVNICYLKS